MGKRRSSAEWNQLRSAFLAGAELRGLARAAGISEGTVLARASREGWSRQREEARLVVAPPEAGERVLEAVARESGNRAERHLDRMRRFTDRVGDTVERLDGNAGLLRIGQVDRFDTLTRRTLGIRDPSQSPAVLINVARIMAR